MWSRSWWAGGQAGVLRFSSPLMMCKWYCCELPRLLLCLGLRSWHLLAAACDETSCWRLKALSMWLWGDQEGGRTAQSISAPPRSWGCLFSFRECLDMSVWTPDVCNTGGGQASGVNAVGPQLGHWKKGEKKAHGPLTEACQRLTCLPGWLSCQTNRSKSFSHLY